MQFKLFKYFDKNITAFNAYRNYNKLNSNSIDSIKSIFGNNYTISESIRVHYSKDESLHKEALPDAVVFPENSDQISSLLKFCNKNRIPVIPFGAGSGFEGGVNATSGGICVDTSKYMNSVLDVNIEDFDCRVEAGLSRKKLNHHLKDTGLWFPIDPGADACIGGMVSTSASGTNAVRYGTMRENVLNLECILADGTIINTAGLRARARKNVAGYNLTNLMIGSEGTLGIISKINLKLYAQPEIITSAICTFSTINSAVQSSVEIMQTGLQIARIEFLDENSIHANNIYNKMNLDETPTLFLEFHGTKKTVEQQAEVAMDICKQNESKTFKWATDLEERNKLWTARYDSWFAFKALYPNRKAISTDICVPISKIPEMIVQTKKDIQELNIKSIIVGHVGDGNFHTFISVDLTNNEEMKNYNEYTTRLISHALKLDGTCTGEHGIGLGKKKFMIDQFGQDTLDLMKKIKFKFDPNLIMNPKKIFD